MGENMKRQAAESEQHKSTAVKDEVVVDDVVGDEYDEMDHQGLDLSQHLKQEIERVGGLNLDLEEDEESVKEEAKAWDDYYTEDAAIAYGAGEDIASNACGALGMGAGADGGSGASFAPHSAGT